MPDDRRRPRKTTPRVEPLEGRIAPGVIMGDRAVAPRAAIHANQRAMPQLGTSGIRIQAPSSILIPEGDISRSVAIRVKLISAPSLPVTIRYEAESGSATLGQDFQTSSGALKFTPRISTKTARVTIVGDTTNEPSKSFRLVFRDPANNPIRSVRITIQDDDQAVK
jgi:hypothetical protein